MTTEQAQLLQNDELALLFMLILGLIWMILPIVLFFKIWIMTNDMSKIKDILVDMHYRQVTDYESKKRLGKISTEDLDEADKKLKELKFE